MSSKPETGLRRKIQKKAERVYGEAIYIEHPHGSQYSSGMLDLIGCLMGLHFSLEVKMPTNKRGATPKQQHHIDRIRAAEGVAEVVTSVDEAMEVLNGIAERAPEKG